MKDILITCSNCKTNLYRTNRHIARSDGIKHKYFDPVDAKPHQDIFICPICDKNIMNDMRIALFANAGD